MSNTLDTLRDALRDCPVVVSEYDLQDLARKADRDPQNITVYTEILKDLAEWSARVDTAELTPSEYEELQRVRERIERGAAAGRYTRAEGAALLSVWKYVTAGAVTE